MLGNVDGYIDTGSFILNALLSGSIHKGLPINKITAFAGESATGKTFFLLGLCKQFLTDNPGGGVLYFESESALTPEMLEEKSIEKSRFAQIPVALSPAKAVILLIGKPLCILPDNKALRI